jgi:hypothetical protein
VPGVRGTRARAAPLGGSRRRGRDGKPARHPRRGRRRRQDAVDRGVLRPPAGRRRDRGDGRLRGPRRGGRRLYAARRGLRSDLGTELVISMLERAAPELLPLLTSCSLVWPEPFPQMAWSTTSWNARMASRSTPRSCGRRGPDRSPYRRRSGTRSRSGWRGWMSPCRRRFGRRPCSAGTSTRACSPPLPGARSRRRPTHSVRRSRTRSW